DISDRIRGTVATGTFYATLPAAGVAIPDAGTLNSTLTIAGLSNQEIIDVNVNVTIDHGSDSDLVLTLIDPNGTPIVLSNRRGGTGANYTFTTFDDQAATPIAAGTAPFTGSFRPE